MPRDPFQLLGGINQLADGVVLLVSVAQLGAGLHGVIYGLRTEGHLFCHVVYHRIGKAQRPTNVP